MKLLAPGLMDTHCHTEFSFDSKESVEEYLKLAPGPVITTEHLDFENPVTGRDDLPDYKAYRDKWTLLNEIYDGRLKMGIEVGYTRQSQERIGRFLEDKEYDLILLSVHQNGVFDYMDKKVKEELPERLANDYLDNLVLATANFPQAQVLAHVDYGFRAIEYDMALLESLREKFELVLKNIIKSQTALELNTRSMYQFKNLPIYDYVIDIYQGLGGDLYTLGSDAHFKNYYRYQFDQALEFLQTKTKSSL